MSELGQTETFAPKSGAEGEPEGISAKADNIPDAVAAIIAQQMTPRSSIDLKKFNASLDGDAPPAGLGKALQAAICIGSKGKHVRANGIVALADPCRQRR